MRERLGEAVRGVDAPDVLLEPGELRERRAAARSSRTLERSRRAALGMLAERLLLVRPGVDRRGALALDQRERARRARRSPGARGSAPAASVAPSDIAMPAVQKNGMRGVDAVVGHEAASASAKRQALEHRRALRVQHALRARRGARGVDDERVVGRARPRPRSRRAARRRRRAPCASSVAPRLDGAARRGEPRQTTRRSCGSAAQRSAPGRARRDLGMARAAGRRGSGACASAGWSSSSDASAWRRIVVALGGAREGVHGHDHRADERRAASHADDPLGAVRRSSSATRAPFTDPGADQRARERARARARAPRSSARRRRPGSGAPGGRRGAPRRRRGSAAVVSAPRRPRGGALVMPRLAADRCRHVRSASGRSRSAAASRPCPLAITSPSWFVITTFTVRDRLAARGRSGRARRPRRPGR